MNVVLADETDDPLEPLGLPQIALEVLLAEGLPTQTEVSVVLVGTERMAELNTLHMSKAGPTDVLSFPVEQLTPGTIPDVADDGPPFVIGDVFICPEVVKAHCVSDGLDFHDEMALMTVHGLLHLLGYDHVADDDAEVMEAKERLHLAAAGRVRR